MNIERLESIQDQPVILEQPAFWARAFIWLIVGITTSGLLWASLAKIDQSVPAQGKLEPEGSVKEIKLPVGGVVREIHVDGGDEVKEGDLLLTLDSTVSRADVEALREARDQRRSEARAYQAQVSGLDYVGEGNEFDRTQQQRVNARIRELEAQKDATESQIRQLEAQLTQVQGQIAATTAQIENAQNRLTITENGRAADRQQLATAQERFREAQQRLTQARALLDEDRAVLADLEPLLENGGIARLQVTRQRQQVITREREVSSTQDEILERQGEMTQLEEAMQRREAEITSLESDLLARRSEKDRLLGEEQRLRAAVLEANARLQNIIASSQREAYQVIAENQKQDTQLSSQLARAEQELKYTEIRSPIDGIVFEVLPNFAANEETGTTGFVINTTEPAIRIVPNSNLIANVFVTNKDIGFIEEGMEVELQIDAFPATEFGTLPGELVSIGEDVLEPEQNRPFYAFPVTIELEQQYFELKTGRQIDLQAGMAVSANIKVRNRTVLSIFLDRFTGGTRSLENVR
ncbi:MAG: HlyD family efflux transporter periplasmic adaptor subunit [Cyanobacteria bacterium SID2]|nr:HlyD family efflux transporter periplasmic adaptor subunit [Cyanobacteria bacterium SID2]MBP0002135.1 HlyD family efflux transporter periplasmic adaptor subunit [Cyanobacteria bacterium SBC]